MEHTVTADLNAIEKELRPRSIKPANEVYFGPFQLTIQSVCLSILDTTPDYDIPFEFYFDENVILGPRAKAWYPVIRAMSEPRLRAIMPVEPFFRDDKTTMPLQAADLTAWMSRHDKLGTNEFAWLKEHLIGLTRSPCCIDFGSKEIGLLFAEGPIPPEMRWKADAARRAFVDTFIKGARSTMCQSQRSQKRNASAAFVLRAVIEAESLALQARGAGQS